MESGSDDEPWDGLNDRTFTLNVFGFAPLAWTAGAQRFYQPPTPDDAAVGDGVKRTPRCGLEEAPASIEKMSRDRVMLDAVSPVPDLVGGCSL